MKGCEFCNARHLMQKIMNSIEELPEFNVPLYDDPVSDVFNAADHAFNSLQCYCSDTAQSKSRPTIHAADLPVACDHEWVERPPHNYLFCRFCNIGKPLMQVRWADSSKQ